MMGKGKVGVTCGDYSCIREIIAIPDLLMGSYWLSRGEETNDLDSVPYSESVVAGI